jgi:hypothetical protein
MTLRRLLGQRRRDGKTALLENRPGPLPTPHINGAKINKFITLVISRILNSYTSYDRGL